MHDSVAKSNMVSVQNLIRAANFDRSLRKIHLSVILHLHQSIDHFQAVWVFSKENILFLYFTWKVSSFKYILRWKNYVFLQIKQIILLNKNAFCPVNLLKAIPKRIKPEIRSSDWLEFRPIGRTKEDLLYPWTPHIYVGPAFFQKILHNSKFTYYQI